MCWFLCTSALTAEEEEENKVPPTVFELEIYLFSWLKKIRLGDQCMEGLLPLKYKPSISQRRSVKCRAFKLRKYVVHVKGLIALYTHQKLKCA